MLVVPLRATPAQKVTVSLGGQVTQIQVEQKSTGMFVDVSVDNSLIIGGVACEDRNRIVRNSYLGFLGDLAFVDTQGTADPDYTGLGARFQLLWFAPGELPAAGGAE